MKMIINNSYKKVMRTRIYDITKTTTMRGSITRNNTTNKHILITSQSTLHPSDIPIIKVIKLWRRRIFLYSEGKSEKEGFETLGSDIILIMYVLYKESGCPLKEKEIENSLEKVRGRELYDSWRKEWWYELEVKNMDNQEKSTSLSWKEIFLYLDSSSKPKWFLQFVQPLQQYQHIQLFNAFRGNIRVFVILGSF